MGVNYNALPIVTDGMVLCLDAANSKSYPGSGTTVTGLTGLESSGQVSGATYSSDNLGFFEFDGSNDYLQIDTSNDISGNNSWTMNIWANINSSENGTGRQGWLIWQGSSGQASSQLISMGVNNGAIEIAHWANDSRFSNATISFDTWEQYTCTFDGTTERVYVNGEEAGTKNTTLQITEGTWYIASRAAALEYLNMKVSLFQLYNRALSSDEVMQNYNATKSRYGI